MKSTKDVNVMKMNYLNYVLFYLYKTRFHNVNP